jgi:hypothetical protein
MSPFPVNNVVRWIMTNGNVIAVIVTAGVAAFLACCLGCSKCPCRDKDDIFRHRSV